MKIYIYKRKKYQLKKAKEKLLCFGCDLGGVKLGHCKILNSKTLSCKIGMVFKKC